MKIERLDQDSFDKLYQKAWEPITEITVEELEKEFEALDSRLKEGFESAGYEEENDYELMFEWQETYHHCGGIYSHRAHSPETLKIVSEALSEAKEPQKWIIHFACEATEDFEGAQDMGQFFVQDNVAYFVEDGTKFHQLFETNQS
ncbi:MAG: hypothetical protein AAF546_07190 [Verrucomicrobiota bacterium]